MRRKSLTIWIAPDIYRKVHSLTLHHTVIKLTILALLTGAIGITTLLITLTARYKTMKTRVAALDSLKEENKKQQEQIAYFTDNLKGLEEQVGKLKEFGQKLRVMTSLEPVKTSEKPNSKYGLGGPLEGAEDLWEDAASLGSFLKEGQAGGSTRIEDLTVQIVIQEQSFQEIEKALKRQRNRLLSTPSIWPVKGLVASGFGKRVSPFTGETEMHRGIDILARAGTSVKAAANGLVTEVGTMPGLGNYITITHGNGVVTRYGHNKKNLVKKGERISRGQTIARVGNSGRTTGPHLHYEVVVKGKYVNPFLYIPNYGEG